MNRQETAKVVFTIKATYPRHFEKMGGQELNNMIDAWTHFLKDYDYSDVSRAVDIYVMSNTTGFPPDPGQLAKCLALDNPANELTATEAWAMVEKVVRGTPWERYQDEYDKLPKPIQRAIGTAASLKEMGMIDETQLINEKARFIHAYNALMKRETEFAALPSSVQAAINQRYADRLGTNTDNETRLLEYAT